MSVLRFTGSSSRDVMRQVRAALGDDALILANRRIDQGVEILAMADDAVENMASRTSNAPSPPAASPTPASAPSSASNGETALQAMSERLLSEMQDMRTLLAQERARHHPERDGRGRLQRLLREAGFSCALADELLASLPAELGDTEADDARPLAWLQRCLASRMAVLDSEDDFFEPPGILALIGPTGIGKTTTTAKLAARFVQRHGADRVALITTDSFRIGAHEQLRIYAELLGIPMHALAHDQPIDTLAARLADRRWVIIDTVGMSQRDQRVVDQIAKLHAGRTRVRMLLLLNAASQPDTLNEVITHYRQAARAAGGQIDDCLLTKQDEACRLAPVFEAIVSHGLRLNFVSHGQRVPEDLCLPDAAALAAKALATRSPLDDAHASRTPARPVAPPSGLFGQARQLTASLHRLRRRFDGFSLLEAAWDFAELPDPQQRHRLDRLLTGKAGESPRDGIYWASRRSVSGGWRMPDLGLDARGNWTIPPTLQHRQPAGEPERLTAAIDAGIGVHLFAGLPEAATRHHLAESAAGWACRTTAGQRVSYRGERQPLSRLLALATPSGELSCRLNGRPVLASLAQLPVVLSPARRCGPPDNGPDAGQALRAWFAELREAESGRTLGKRFWLTPAAKSDAAVPLLAVLLRAEELPRQTRQAQALLADWLPGATRPLRLLLAAGIAAAAAHIDHATDEGAMDLRAELLGMLGSRRRRRDSALLMALLQFFSARDAIRRLQTIDTGTL